MSFWITMHDTSIEACKLYFIKKTSLLSIWFLIWCRKKYQRQTNLCQMNKTEKLCGFDWITESCEVHLAESMLVSVFNNAQLHVAYWFPRTFEWNIWLYSINCLSNEGLRTTPFESSVFRPKTVTPSIFCWFFSKTDLIRSVRKIISLQTVVGI